MQHLRLPAVLGLLVACSPGQANPGQAMCVTCDPMTSTFGTGAISADMCYGKL